MNELITPSLLWFLFGYFLLFIETLTPAMIILTFGFGAWVAAIFAAYTEIGSTLRRFALKEVNTR